jgi:hypothetical protein
VKTDSPREGLLLNPAGDRIQTYNLLLTRQLHYHCATPAYLAGEEDLNPRHVVLETTALPTELCPYKQAAGTYPAMRFLFDYGCGRQI